MLVEQQGETMKNIETFTEATAVQLEEGSKQIEKAVQSARATRSVCPHTIDLYDSL